MKTERMENGAPTKYDVLKRACRNIVLEDLAKPIVSTISAFVLPGDLQKKVSEKLKLCDDEGEERLRDRVYGYIDAHYLPRDAAKLMKTSTSDNMQVKHRMHAVATLEFGMGIIGFLPATAVGPHGMLLALYVIADGYIRKRTVSSSSLCYGPYCGCDFGFEPKLDGEPCGTIAVEVPYQIGKAAYEYLKGTYEDAKVELLGGDRT